MLPTTAWYRVALSSNLCVGMNLAYESELLTTVAMISTGPYIEGRRRVGLVFAVIVGSAAFVTDLT